MNRRRFPRWLKVLGVVVAVLLVGMLALFIGLGWYVKNQFLESGGVLPPSMAAYDIRHYDLELAIDPAERHIEGRNTVTVEAIEPISVFEVHLDNRLDVETVTVDGADCSFDHRGGVISVKVPVEWAAGERHSVMIDYGGAPKVALQPPWIDGFVWSETPSGEPWIGVTGQGDGGDNWWPCKDHPSDEPDEGMNIALTVPAGLVALSNGRFLGETDNGDGTVTARWQVSYPINNYLVTVNIAPYVAVEERYYGVDGDLDIPLVFWSLPEFEKEARQMWRQMPTILEVLGRNFGEYPFFDDKFAVAHAPYLGMEHQTLVAYGADFTDNAFDFDWLLLHEVSHEWWGNKITVSDWADFWIHESFGRYAEAIFVLDTLGEARYLEYMSRVRQQISNKVPIVQGDNLTSAQAYTGDIYHKGAWVLHTLRWLVGNEGFIDIIWRFADGDNPSACRFVSTEDFIELVDELTGRDLGWFWDRYLFRAELPQWLIERSSEGGSERIVISWDDPDFELPLPVSVGGEMRRVEMSGGRAEFVVEPGTVIEIDPEGRILAESIH
jgi:aminopeptidase N